MEEEQSKQKSDKAIAWNWAQWPTYFGIFVGISLTNDVFDKVTKPHSIFDAILLGVSFSAMYAALLGGVTFGVVFLFLKAKRHIFKRT